MKIVKNSKINLFNLSLWAFTAALILFFVAGLFEQMILAVIFSVIAGFWVLVAITQTKFFEKLCVYLQPVKAHEPAWVRAMIIAVGILAILISVFLFFSQAI